MSTEQPPIYLVTPEHADPDRLIPALEAALDTGLVACVRLSLASTDEADWERMANRLSPVTLARDVALVVRDHFRLVPRLGLDGVHLSGGRTPLRRVRNELGDDRIVGGFAGAERHQGMVLAEAGADYVSVGPVGSVGALGDGSQAGLELFEWWSEMIETPVVAEGGVTLAHAAALKGLADFVAPGPAIWRGYRSGAQGLRGRLHLSRRHTFSSRYSRSHGLMTCMNSSYSWVFTAS